jgi:hypothetical protein
VSIHLIWTNSEWFSSWHIRTFSATKPIYLRKFIAFLWLFSNFMIPAIFLPLHFFYIWCFRKLNFEKRPIPYPSYALWALQHNYVKNCLNMPNFVCISWENSYLIVICIYIHEYSHFRFLFCNLIGPTLFRIRPPTEHRASWCEPQASNRENEMLNCVVISCVVFLCGIFEYFLA